MKTAAFVTLVIACFALGGNAHRAAVAAESATKLTLPSGWLLAVALMLGLQEGFYTIDGLDGVIYMGEEVRAPETDVPLATLDSVFSIMGIYLLVNAAVLYVLPMNEIAANNFSL